MFCPGPFHFPQISDFCPLTDSDVRVSIVVCDVEHTSFYLGL